MSRLDLSKTKRRIRNAHCELCPLSEKAEKVCIMGDGAFRKKVFILGEAPGFQEDKLGKPFVGTAGKLLRSELIRVGISPTSCYLTNTVKCFPDGTPTEEQSNICASHYLSNELSELNPDFILALGNTALRAITRGERISEARGQIWEATIGSAFVYPTYHPAYILRNRREMTTFQIDLENFAAMINL